MSSLEIPDVISWRAGRGLDRYVYMFEHALNTDCTFNVEDQQIEAHRFVLSVGSPVFEAMFLADMSEKKTGVINITDISSDTFKSVLRYMYTYKLEFKDLEDAVEIYLVAHKYQLEDLGVLCQERIKRDVSPDNVWKIIDLAQTLDDQTLIDQCVQVLRSDTDACLKFVTLATLSEDHLLLLLSQESLSLEAGELYLVHLALNWARTKAVQRGLQGSDGDVREIVLPRLLPLLRLASLKEAEFNIIVNLGQWLSEKDKQMLISKNTDEFPDYLCKNLKSRNVFVKSRTLLKKIFSNTATINLPITIVQSEIKNLKMSRGDQLCCVELSASENIHLNSFVMSTQVSPDHVMNNVFEPSDTYQENLHVTVINLTDSDIIFDRWNNVDVNSVIAVVATTKYEGQAKYNSSLSLEFTDPVDLVKNKVYRIKVRSMCAFGWYQVPTSSSLSEFMVKNILFKPSYNSTNNVSLFKSLTMSYE